MITIINLIEIILLSGVLVILGICVISACIISSEERKLNKEHEEIKKILKKNDSNC